MELDSFLATPRWEILKIIIQKPSSPIEISETLKTTTSFVSQQLKLLEATGLVKKEKTGAFEKGKPRTLFSISQESLYLIPLAKNAPDKKLIPLSREQKTITNIWCIENTEIQIPLQKFFWQIQEFLDEIISISIYTNSTTPKVYIFSNNPSLSHKINETQKNLENKLAFQVVSSLAPLEKLETKHLFSIYVAHESASDDFNLKGGLKKDE
jgi:predicted transcriptional regulator